MVKAGADHLGVLQEFRTWDVANPRTTTPFPNKLLHMVLHGRRNLILDDDLFAGFGVWFGLRWIFSEDHHLIIFYSQSTTTRSTLGLIV